MNTHLLAHEIVTKIRASLQDSVLNQSGMVERMIREAMKADCKNCIQGNVCPLEEAEKERDEARAMLAYAEQRLTRIPINQLTP